MAIDPVCKMTVDEKKLGRRRRTIQAAIAAGSLRLSSQGKPVGYLPKPMAAR